MKAKSVILPGDGIGPEVIKVSQKILEQISHKFDHQFEIEEQLIGGIAIDKEQNPLPHETSKACLEADAVLLGAVGGPKWDDPTAKMRPEQGLLGLRKKLDLFANLRPINPHHDLISASPLKEEKLLGVDFIVVRELTGGIYFGQPSERRVVDGQIQSLDTMVYNESEIERVANLAFNLARERSGKLTSVDKANVLESSRLWREVVTRVAKEHSDIELEHLLVDAAAMHLLTRPATFDVIVTANLFGDILTDEASILTGSLGNLPSASIGNQLNSLGYPRGVYEPIHGSAPDIAGLGIANPIGTILSTAMMLRHSLGLETEAKAIEKVIDDVLTAGYRTADLVNDGETEISTEVLSGHILERLD